MDLNSIVFAGVFIVLGGMFLVFSVSFIAYKVSNKQTSKVPVQSFQTQQYHQPKPAPVQYFKVPVQQYQRCGKLLPLSRAC